MNAIISSNIPLEIAFFNKSFLIRIIVVPNNNSAMLLEYIELISKKTLKIINENKNKIQSIIIVLDLVGGIFLNFFIKTTSYITAAIPPIKKPNNISSKLTPKKDNK